MQRVYDRVSRLVLLVGACSVTARAVAVDLEQSLGQPADIAPSAYLFRSDLRPEENPPETALLFTNAIPHAKAGVLAGLLWEEPQPIARVELLWPEDASAVPPPRDLIIRWQPHGPSSSWWSRRPGGGGELSIATADVAPVAGDPRRYAATLDAATQERAADNLVVALKDGAPRPPEPYAVPTVRVLTPETWKLVEAEIEWGFQDTTRERAFDRRIECYNGILGRPVPLAGDAATRMTETCTWTSKPAGSARRGIRLAILYLGATQNTKTWTQHARLERANGTIVTVLTASGSFSFLAADLETGPILAGEYGFFVRPVRFRKPSAAASPPPELAVTQGLLRDKVEPIAGGAGLSGWGSNATPWFGANP